MDGAGLCIMFSVEDFAKLHVLEQEASWPLSYDNLT